MRRTDARDESLASLAAWQAAWRGIGAVHIPDASVRDDVLSRYEEPHRAYHSRRHLDECLALLDRYAHLANRPDEIALALWFHDAIYAPRRRDNEKRSADWLADVARAARVDAGTIARLHALVMATCHAAQPVDDDQRLLVDIDLAILGADAARFEEYERDIRREYRHVPRIFYRFARRRVLREFASREPLFLVPELRERFEQRARDNLARTLGGLR